MEVDLLLNLIQINVCNGSLVAVKDLGQLLERGTAGLDVEEVHEHELDEDPDGVDE